VKNSYGGLFLSILSLMVVAGGAAAPSQVVGFNGEVFVGLRKYICEWYMYSFSLFYRVNEEDLGDRHFMRIVVFVGVFLS
jgi:hypothetical protein